ncbi:hypothetical protein M1M25_gp015 [Tenacibaculum phage Gundel_1]|uniref:Uncharacterized protein n=1 Tax=Tenacibaculum phage Gundel_1 TaxID=2745672 RepID=A0A8E4ZMU1_9CAUD|nr:hypothetical protein M1M25_gp015 [Tenacibaculum phage Gundel_1]QQV91445.1 hypothetical protein Gundel1_15 [Tenacibaculum phage Gundel_1]
MADFYSINGYWKDDKTEFKELIVSEMDGCFEGIEPYSDDDIFFYGLSESNLLEAIELKEETAHDFVITSFTKIIQ